jgi:hypothetical protein
MRRIVLGVALLLGGCGSAAGLKLPRGEALPVAPIGARTPPTAAELLAPTTQQRPARSDELLRRSDERRSDDFDLPPPG